MFRKLIGFSFNHPRTIMAITFIAVLLALSQFPRMKVDTDPENMLPEKEFVRVFHREVTREFSLYDFIVLGVVNESDSQGVFTVDTLNKVYAITERIKGISGVINREIIAPSTKDNIRQGGVGAVVFEWLMDQPIDSDEAARQIRDGALNNPMFYGSMVSEDGKALCLYIPIEQKKMSYRIAQEIQKIINDLPGSERYYITGLPVAEDTFGVEMFKQMAISAPLAGLIIFLLMLMFFRNIKLIIAPMLIAMATVLLTMGLLIGFKFPVHIMSSMIPIFLMPIAVLDSVHILSEFFEKYRVHGNKEKTILEVMNELFTPMLYTSLTTIAGFFSLSFSEIPPVQVFGVFVAAGVAIAWVLTMAFIPAYVALMSERSFVSSHSKDSAEEEGPGHGIMNVLLQNVQRFCQRHYAAVLWMTVFLIGVSCYGISLIQVNDNPVRWFTTQHRIRIADRVLNSHFSGTYMAYLVLSAKDVGGEIFVEPEMLRYVEKFQEHLLLNGDVGKLTSLADVVKKVYYELLGGDKINNVIPPTKKAVAQCLISFENSHKPDDLWHMTNPDYSRLNIWVQLKSGDNKDMARVVRQTDEFMRLNPPPYPIVYQWAGKSYINMIWQDKMVVGMLVNFLGSFIIVFFMMMYLFRSPVAGLVSMIPLTVTIVFIYSLLGFIGKDYDMPVAVLSALTLGLSVDYAIHFIQRARELLTEHKTPEQISVIMFGSPGRAIIRNALVVAIGFMPLLFAPLVPYRTVGFFMFTIMFVSSLSTLFILPALLAWKPHWIFGVSERGLTCNCQYCVITATAVGLTLLYILRGYSLANWGISSIASIFVIAVLAGICSNLSRRKQCTKEKQ
jgi:uncharacterized protein